MSKHTDLIQILSLVIMGMFVPFIISIIIVFGLDLTNINDLFKITRTFGWFLLIFGIELGVVYLYFKITAKIANKKINNLKQKK